MTEKIRLSKEVDKAIIMSLKVQPEIRLSSARITDYVMKYINIKDKRNIYRKIERMAEKRYLLHFEDVDGDYIYYLNPDIEYIPEGPDLKLLNDLMEGATPAQVEHTSVLKKAIRAWIDNLPEPNPGFPTIANSQGSPAIVACESHILFKDLANHLPAMGMDVCARWTDYKKELAQLDKLKQDLVSSLRTGILNCFEGLDLRFIYDMERYLEDYECRLGPATLYDVVIRLESGDEGYDNHMRFLSWLENNAPIVEKGDYVLWGETITHLRVPMKDRALLETGAMKFLVFFKNIPDSEFLVMAEGIIAKVDKLKSERGYILRQLEEAMIYANFQGECQYLQ
jgi:hypothetical protein